MATKHYLFPSDYMADPSVHVYNGKIYIYPSHDWESRAGEDDDGGHFQMKDYHVLTLSNPDEGEAEDQGMIFDVNEVPWAEKQLWDSDVVEKDGKYYNIFSGKGYDGVFRLGVAVADKPEGPFVPQPFPIRGSFSIDPCVFKDDDGSIYTYFGGLWGGQLQWWQPFEPGFEPIIGKHGDENGLTDMGSAPTRQHELFADPDMPALPSFVAKMSDDVLQFAEAPRRVVVLGEDGKPLKASDPHRFFEASWVFKKDGKYYFTYSTGDSHLLCYAVGDNPYGPFKYEGVILTPVVGWTTHHSIIEYKGKWYLFHHDSVPSEGKTWLRSLKVCELEWDENGKIKTIEGLD
ncbi:MAG: family 43 glycosylhydrolase [Bacteroidaceae bacterium]|nr:family 43 glycosylhydrolase [Bacteroidaceae bacterium]